MIQDTIKNLIQDALTSFGVPKDMVVINLDHPTDFAHGDYSSNIAMVLFKSLGASTKSPFELAEKIAAHISTSIKGAASHYVKKVEAVRPGFINFYLSNKFFSDSIEEILEKTAWYGKNTKLWNKKVIIEHTNLNPFKPFHIGHLVNNAIGESLSRIFEFQDMKLSRASYGGDVGLHVAKTLWGVMKLQQEFPQTEELHQQIAFLGKAYVLGSSKYDEDPAAAEEMKALNKKIYEKTDSHIVSLYEWGREVSLKYFKELYKRLDTHFDYSFFESEVADEGKAIVMSGLSRGIFTESEGAIIFKGEDYGLHNRVFITSQGLPTYEAKELGLTKKKFELHDFDYSVIITASEQNDYFKVVLKALEQLYPEVARRTNQIGTGMLRFSSGKMSSRKGNVITAEEFLAELEEMVVEKMKDREYSDAEKKYIAEKVAFAAIRYTILRQSPGKDIIFDEEKSVSFEGDSGPYLQYTYVRAKSVLAKAEAEHIKPKVKLHADDELSTLERLLYKFPEIVERAGVDYAPNYIATYLIELAGAFNSYYANTKIVDTGDKTAPYKVALTEAVSWVLKNGLYLLGIAVPEKM